MMLWGVGNSIHDPRYDYITQVATGKTFEVTNQSYAHLWDNAMKNMGINTYSLGEYGMTDRITFKAVYHSTHSYGDKFTQSGGDTWLEKGIVFFHLDKLFGIYHDLEWEHEHIKNISNGEHIYIYPHLDIDIPGGDTSLGGTDLKQYIFVRTFDAYSGGNEWLHDPDTKDVSLSGDRCQWIPQLNCGVMGRYDLYYVIDVAYFNQDLIGSIPGLNLLTDSDIEQLIKEDKARFMERYGGVIYGDEHQDTPDALSYHELQYSQSGGINTFFDTIKDIQIGWTAFTTTDNAVINRGFEIIMTIFAMIFGLAIYYEIKSYLPFISGGDGGE